MERRLIVAKELGADKVLLIKKDTKEEDNVKLIHKMFNGEPDNTIEASGALSSIRLAILATKAGGCVVLVGMGAAEVQIPLIDALIREVDIRGVFRYVNE